MPANLDAVAAVSSGFSRNRLEVSLSTHATGLNSVNSIDPEVDIVGVDREPVAKRITVVGSVKWLENRAFDAHDLAWLITHRAQLPGADDSTPLLAVSRNGTTTDGVLALGPDDLLAAWQGEPDS